MLWLSPTRSWLLTWLRWYWRQIWSGSVSAHLVLGWDADRLEVTDFGWDYLPVLGYAVRNQGSDEYVLYEGIDDKLFALDEERAKELGILGQAGAAHWRSQPTIVECLSVKPFITNYTRADCMLSDGQAAEILTFVKPGSLPGHRMDVGSDLSMLEVILATTRPPHKHDTHCFYFWRCP